MVAEKDAVAQDLDEIIRRDEQEEKPGQESDMVRFPSSDVKKTPQYSHHRRENPRPIVMSINPLSSGCPGFS